MEGCIGETITILDAQVQGQNPGNREGSLEFTFPSFVKDEKSKKESSF